MGAGTDGGSLLRPVPVPGLAIGVQADSPLVVLQRAHPRLVVRRTFQDYEDAFVEAFPDGFETGLRTGLKELVVGKIIDQQMAAGILHSHRPLTLRPDGWKAHFPKGERDPVIHAEEGQIAGSGMGEDQGYDDAVTLFGYSRKYGAMKKADRDDALLDNNGVCVYCNAAPCADVDHIHPLKVHWQTKGAQMDDLSRSAEANHPNNLVGTCANCNRSKGSRILKVGWTPPHPAWGAAWWPFGPARVAAKNSPPPYW